MRNRALHDALRDFALDAAALLSAELRAGHEIPFDVVEEPGRGPILYRYRPLTKQFLATRWNKLRELPTCAPAARALGAGATVYMRVCGLSDGDAEPALQAMLERLYEDATSFEFPEERFERVYGEVERALFENTIRTALIAPLHGAEMEHDRVDLGEGMFLIAGDKLDAPPGAVWGDATGHVERGGPPNVLCVLRRDIAADEQLPVSEARIRFRKLLTALRLFKPGAVAFGPVGWGRVDEGAWQPIPIGLTGPGRGAPWTLLADEQAELVELVDLVAGARPGGRIAWALSRFEMGSERAVDAEALSDYLLALRSLLDATDDAGSAALTRRVATLCAEDDGRKAMQRRLELAFTLEHKVMAGATQFDPDGPDTPRSIVLEIEQHVRALLRDVLCGYLSSDLKSVADDLLITGTQHMEIHAEDIREPEQPQLDEDPGVTPSADWELDDDPASYSAPI
jgi:hypothetical protein